MNHVIVHLQQPTRQSFGLLIAYVIPGSLFLLGALHQDSLLIFNEGDPTIAGFLYSTLCAIGLGMTLSAIRWLTIDSLHHATGIQKPDWDFRKLTSSVGAFSLLVEHHYRYYEFFSNMFLALLLVYPANRLWGNLEVSFLVDAAVVLLEVVYFMAARGALARYYERVGELLREVT